MFVVTGLFVRLFINGEMLPDRKIGCHSAHTKHLTQATSQRKDGGKKFFPENIINYPVLHRALFFKKYCEKCVWPPGPESGLSCFETTFNG